MHITLWGTRGSTPIASPSTTHYGGNTTCVEVCTDAGDIIILDAGTGIRPLGDAMMQDLGMSTMARTCTLCLTHAHWDHLMGLPFFTPLYSPLWQVNIHAQEDMGGSSLRTVLQGVFNGVHFPLLWQNLPHHPILKPCKAGDSFRVGTALVETCCTQHPGNNVAYKITADGWSFLFSGDHEYLPGDTGPLQKPFLDLLQGTDVALLDGQFTREEYAHCQGWGHAALEDLPPLALQAGVNRLLITHHAPSRTDAELDALQHDLRRAHANTRLSIDMAREGMRCDANSCTSPGTSPGNDRSLCPARLSQSNTNRHICEFSREMFRFSDMGMVLDSLLSEARRFSGAEAGTIYLTSGDTLIFSYAQNDVLFKGSESIKQLYLTASLPISTASIAGYVAVTSRTLNIPNVRKLPPGLPCVFNESFDNITGYRTVSMLTVPFPGKNGKILGVIQLINCQHKGKPVPFPPHIQQMTETLSMLGAYSIERAYLAREMILRMLQTSALRDPLETANHVMRVGACAAEIYSQWAKNQRVPLENLRDFKDNIRLAAMLHDVGKVGIPDAILKKPGKLTPEERAIMEQHCSLGARLFASASLETDVLAREIAQHHHQRWDGTGYTGDSAIPLLAGLDIPLGARIVALADVFDALISRRCYKEPWPIAQALAYIKDSEGSHFDPQVVQAFLAIEDIIVTIYERFPDTLDPTLTL